jgi:ribosomal protein L37AE/L43A
MSNRSNEYRRTCPLCNKQYITSLKELDKIEGVFICKHCRTAYKKGCFDPRKDMTKKYLLDPPPRKTEYRPHFKRKIVYDPIVSLDIDNPVSDIDF